MFCHHCGVKLNEGSLFCHACGTKVVSETSPVVNEQPIMPAQHQPSREPVTEKKGTPFIVIGWVSFGLSLVFFLSPIVLPIIFGLLAIIMGILVINVRNQAHGIILTVLAVVGSLLSISIGHAVRLVISHSYYYF